MSHEDKVDAALIVLALSSIAGALIAAKLSRRLHVS